MTATERLGCSTLRSVAVQSTHIQRVQLLDSSRSVKTSRISVGLTVRRRWQRPWRVKSWLSLLLGFLYCVTYCGAPAAASTTLGGHNNHNSNMVGPSSDLYIVLVSIPVLDKMLPLKHLAETLLSRGVRVGYALPEDCRQWASDVEGLEFISLSGVSSKDRASALDSGSYKALTFMKTMSIRCDTMRRSSGQCFDHYGKIWNMIDQILWWWIDTLFAGFDVCHQLELPYVVNDPHLLLDIDSPPAYIPAPFSSYTMHTLSVLERCLNSYYRLRFRLGLVNVYKEINAVRREHGLAAIETKHQMHGQVLVLVNSVFGLDEARPMTPQFRMTEQVSSVSDEVVRRSGEPRKTIDLHQPACRCAFDVRVLRNYRMSRAVLENGSHVDPWLTIISLWDEYGQMNALETVHARLLWKATVHEQAAYDLRARPRDSVLFLGEGLEDAAILALVPEIELLITTGDFQSMQEALVVGVPILGLPCSAEQLEGVDAVERAGAGIRLDGKALSESSIRLAVERILLEDKEYFTSNAEHVGELVKTGGGVDRAVDEVLAVTEFGSRHLLPMRNLQPLYKVYLVDVYLIYGVILCGAAIILRTFVSLVLSVFQPVALLGVPKAEDVAANDQSS